MNSLGMQSHTNGINYACFAPYIGEDPRKIQYTSLALLQRTSINHSPKFAYNKVLSEREHLPLHCTNFRFPRKWVIHPVINVPSHTSKTRENCFINRITQ